MQYLYVLTSTPNDIFYEQFLLSVKSLRLLMPNAEIVLLCDAKTKDTLTGKREIHQNIITKTISVDVPPDFSQTEVSRWLKTSMRCIVSGDFLYIDCDTIITDDLSSIKDIGKKFGVCLDKHSLIDRHGKKNNIIENDKKLGFSSYLSNKHFNGGILYCPDTPEIHKLFERWHELWLFCKSKNIIRDMPSLNMAIYENPSFCTELDGTWNCQIAYNGLPYLANSKIIHYFATDLNFYSSPFILASENILKQIKENGAISVEILELLKNPRAAFVPETRIISGDDMLSVINSNYFASIFFLKKKTPRLFSFINILCSISKKIIKSYIIRTNRKKNIDKNIYN